MARTAKVHGRGTGIRPQQGFSLLEVLLAAMVMSSGLAGLAALLLAAVGGTTEAALRGHATLLANTMVSTVQLAPDGLTAFVNPGGYTECPVGTTCPPERFASASMAQWLDQIAEALPGGAGLVCLDSTPWDGSVSDPACDGADPLVVKVFWSGAPGAHQASQRIVQVVP